MFEIIIISYAPNEHLRTLRLVEMCLIMFVLHLLQSHMDGDHLWNPHLLKKPWMQIKCNLCTNTNQLIISVFQVRQVK